LQLLGELKDGVDLLRDWTSGRFPNSHRLGEGREDSPGAGAAPAKRERTEMSACDEATKILEVAPIEDPDIFLPYLMEEKRGG